VTRRDRLAGLVPTLVIARRNLARARGRTALAVLAIVIGVVAIGAIGAGGAAFKDSQLQRVQAQGATDVFVSPGVDKAEQSFDRSDIHAISDTVGPAGIVATDRVRLDWRRRGTRRERVSATFIDDLRALHRVDRGTLPRNWRREAVVSARFAAAHDLAPGDRLTLVRNPAGDETVRTHRIAAVLAPSEAFGTSDIYLPIEQADQRRYTQVRITTGSVERAERAAGALRDRFNDRKTRLLVFELTGLVRLFRQIVTGINLFLAGLAAISLLVAGVAIANTMLMAVLKRREEIGALRAVGYSKRDILRLLLVEAALLGAIGAAIGGAIAVVIAAVANAIFLGDPFAFSPTAVGYLVVAVAFGIGVSLLAGVYPAWRAANERPVDALRG
jgi:putative ABC transport system permease protein